MEIKSETKDTPLFSLKNFLKPTAKNVLIWCNGIKVGCATLIGFATTMITTNAAYSIIIIVLALIGGFIADSIITFTREEPVETLLQASHDTTEDIKDKLNEATSDVGKV